VTSPTPGARIAHLPGDMRRAAHTERMLAFAEAHERGEIMPAVRGAIDTIRDDMTNVVMLERVQRIEP